MSIYIAYISRPQVYKTKKRAPTFAGQGSALNMMFYETQKNRQFTTVPLA